MIIRRGTKVRIKPEYSHLYPTIDPDQVYEVFDTVLDRICLGGEIGSPPSVLAFKSKFIVIG